MIKKIYGYWLRTQTKSTQLMSSYTDKWAVVAPWVNATEVRKEYGVQLTTLPEVKNTNCVIAPIVHNEFKQILLEKLTPYLILMRQ